MMKSCLLVLLLSLIAHPLTIMAASPFVGDWDLTQTLDEESHQRALPPEQNFQFHIEEHMEGLLTLSTRLGNTMRTKITLKGGASPESQQVEIGNVLSTMMMPAPEVFEVEKYLSKTLPTITKMEIRDGQLLFEGKGTVVCSSA